MEKFDTLMFFAFTKSTIFHFDIQLFLLSLGMFLGFITHFLIHFFLVTMSFHFAFQKKWVALVLVGFFHALINYLMLKTPIYLNDLDSLYLNILTKLMIMALAGITVHAVKIYKSNNPVP
ncbi:MAG: hypothetical protein L3J05_07180 [Robiginitomaculum sp.]|nr:hypothetical protein [Robiginitomaculum sp.]